MMWALLMIIFLQGLIAQGFSVPLSPILTPSQEILAKTSSLSDSFEVPLQLAYLPQYYLNLIIGTPLREIHLSLDTNTPLLWVCSSNCSDSNTYKHRPSESSSYKALNSTETIQHEIGSVQGVLSTENFMLSKEKLYGKIFLLAQYKQGLDWLVSDGIFGLGFSNQEKGLFNFIDLLAEGKIIENRTFAIFLSRDEKLKQSEMIFGEFDSDDYLLNDEKNINVTDSEKWEATVLRFTIQNSTFEEPIQAFFNPGFSYLAGPQFYIEKIVQEIRKNANCSYDFLLTCEVGSINITNLPVVSLFIDNNTYSISPETYLYYSDKIYVLWVDLNHTYWELGLPLFKEYFSVFDIDQRKISFYKITNNGKPSAIIYLIVFVFVLITIVVPTFVYCIFSRRLKNEALRAEVENQNTEPLIKHES